MPRNQKQKLSSIGTITAGTLRLSVTAGGSTQQTANIAYNASNATFDSSIEALSNVDDVVVTGGSFPGTPIVIEQRGVNAEDNLALMDVDATSVVGTKYATVAEVTPGSSSPGEGATHYWKCDEASGTRADSIGSADAVIQVSPISSVSGKISNAIGRAASSSGNGLQAVFSLAECDLYSGFSLSFWFNHDSLTVEASQLISLGSRSTGSLWRAYIRRPGGVGSDRFLTFEGSAAGNLYLSQVVSGGSWHHAVCVLDFENRTGYLYVDGVLTGSDLYGFNAASIPIGWIVFGSDRAYLDEICFWPKKISADDVTFFYNSGSPGSSQQPAFAASVDEVQSVTVSGAPTEGSFRLGYLGNYTPDIAYDEATGVIQAYLEGLAGIAVGDVVVGGGPLPGSPVTITFQSNLGSQDVALLTVDDSKLKTKVEVVQVATSCSNAEQTLTGTATSGSFSLTIDGQTTGSLACDSSAVTIQSAIEGLSSAGVGNVICGDGPLGSSAVTIEFTDAMGGMSQDLITVNAGTLSGGSVTAAIVVAGGCGSTSSFLLLGIG